MGWGSGAIGLLLYFIIFPGFSVVSSESELEWSWFKAFVHLILRISMSFNSIEVGSVKKALDKSTTYLGNFVPFAMHFWTKLGRFSNSVSSVSFTIFLGSNALRNSFGFQILTTRKVTSNGCHRYVNIIWMWWLSEILVIIPDWCDIWITLSSYLNFGNHFLVE